MSTSSRLLATLINAAVILLLTSLAYSMTAQFFDLQTTGFKVVAGLVAIGAIWFAVRVCVRTVRIWA